MKNKQYPWSGILAAVGMTALILDAPTALAGAQEGIEMCLKAVIPSLFPFFVLSSVICSSLLGKELRILRPVCRACKIPQGGEPMLLLGLIGGYPVGAQSIGRSYQDSSLDRESARRMLGFCSNAGPSFIFGMAGNLFSDRRICWLLWMIQILSALIVGVLLPGKQTASIRVQQSKPITLVQSLERSIKSMASVCGWVIIFRVLLSLLNKWFLYLLPEPVQVLIVGTMELTNGCIALQTVESEAIRFLLCTAILSFGGLCVGMQTVAVTKEVGTGYYFPGKVLQCVIASFLSAICIPVLFSVRVDFLFCMLMIVFCTIMLFCWHKKSSRILNHAVV